MAMLIPEIGNTYGNLVVIAKGKKSRKGRYWVCKCQKCGQAKEIRGDRLRSGETVGCSSRCTLSTHSEAHPKTREFAAWDRMLQRCYNKSHKRYKDWGGRGITVCKRWRDSYEAFLLDMGRCPDGLSLDRKDNSNGYCLDNCRWTTRKQQSRNTRANRLISIDGQTKTLAEWLEITGIGRVRFYKRVWGGWSEKDALLIPAKK